MRRKGMELLFAVLVVLGLAASAAAFSLTASGKIVSIDPGQQRLKLRTGLFAMKVFEVGQDAKITDGQQPLQLEQLQPGDRATVEYIKEEGKHVAQSITVDKGQAGPEPIAPASPQPSEEGAPAGPQPSEGAEPSSAAPPTSTESPEEAPSPWKEPVGEPQPQGGGY